MSKHSCLERDVNTGKFDDPCPVCDPERSKAKWTPGPWVVCSASHGTVDVMAETGPGICRMYTEPAINYETPTLLEAEANARLVAAAPQMVEALQQAAIVIGGIPVEQRVGVPGIARIIRAALRAAGVSE